MVTSVLCALLLVPQAAPKPVSLQRVMKVGEKFSYAVKSHLLVEERQIGLDTFLPEELDLNYNFTFDVTKDKADGIVVGRYKRPTITQIEGETAETPPKTTVEKINWDIELTITPINEIIDQKDMNPKKTPPKSGGTLRIATNTMSRAGIQGDIVGSFVSELYRLSLFVGGFDSALDFQPKLEDDEVVPGATWRRTVSYSPQKLKGSNKMAMQRLDYVYTYVGVVESEGKKVHRVNATLNSKTDLAAFLRDAAPEDETVLQLKEIPFNLDAKIEYDLDLNTRTTIQANATSTGGFKLVLTQFPENPIVEQRVKGRTTLRRLAK
jgi:hypothetical protein